jgi:ankyrin repeat protein
VTTSASWNPFAQNSNKAGIVGSQGREDYEAEDVEYYFNYMGILADEGSNDRMDALLNAGKHPIDVILLFAAAEGDVPKIEEILEAGADPKVTDLDGKTPMDLAGANNPGKKDVVVKMLQNAM